jgi:signal peptidase II
MGLIPAGAAIRSSRVRWVMCGLAGAVLAADQVTKSLVLAGHPANGSAFGFVAVRLVRNTGASGGIASGYPVLVTLSAIAVTALAVVLAVRARGRATAVCLAAVLGGALGNLSDRVFRAPGLGRGGVVDWIHLAGRGGSLDLADLAIQFGVLGAVIATILGERARAAGRRRRSGEQASPLGTSGPAGEA